MRLGADPHQLEVLARSVRAAGRELTATARRLDARLASSTWTGPGADRRRAEMRVDVVGALQRVAGQLTEAARVLDDRATAQRVASLAEVSSALQWIDVVGDGRLVERVGDPGAPIVVVLVPGVGNDLGDAAALRDRSRSVWEQLTLVVERDHDGWGRSGSVPPSLAVVTWLGYDPPDVFLGGVDPRPAATGSIRLAHDVADLRSRGAQRVVVVGHSYGALVAARAGAEGLDADELVLLGAPGLGVADPTLGLPAGASVWAAAADGDTVSWVARAGLVHGRDPLDVATRLPTSLRGHSSYFEDPVLLESLARLSLGSGALASRGSGPVAAAISPDLA